MRRSASSTSPAFTLVELAVVLVIIGLIVGGVLLGREMILQGRIKNTVSQIREYTAAVLAFQDKYNGMPGDLKNADAFGLRNDDTGAATACQTTTGPVTYNGNGDGLLQDYGDQNNVRYNGEIKNFAIHLSNAGMIKEKISRDMNSAIGCTNAPVLGEYPPIKVGTSLLTVSDSRSGMLHFVLGGFGESHNLNFSAQTEGTGSNIAQDILTPAEAMMVDSKIDDGKPYQGRSFVITGYLWDYTGNNNAGYLIRDVNISASNCMYDVANYTMAGYNAKLETPECTIAIRLN